MKITPLDARILRLLAEDARQPTLRIAEELGEPESTVRGRINRLVDGGVVSFAAVTDPFQMGFSTWVMIGLKVSLPKIQAVTAELARFEEVYFIAVTTGGFDVMLNATFADNAALHRFLTERLGLIDGINDTSTFVYLSVPKRRIAVLPANDPGPAPPGTPPNARQPIG